MCGGICRGYMTRAKEKDGIEYHCQQNWTSSLSLSVLFLHER